MSCNWPSRTRATRAQRRTFTSSRARGSRCAASRRSPLSPAAPHLSHRQQFRSRAPRAQRSHRVDRTSFSPWPRSPSSCHNPKIRLAQFLAPGNPLRCCRVPKQAFFYTAALAGNSPPGIISRICLKLARASRQCAHYISLRQTRAATERITRHQRQSILGRRRQHRKIRCIDHANQTYEISSRMHRAPPPIEPRNLNCVVPRYPFQRQEPTRAVPGQQQISRLAKSRAAQHACGAKR